MMSSEHSNVYSYNTFVLVFFCLVAIIINVMLFIFLNNKNLGKSIRNSLLSVLSNSLIFEISNILSLFSPLDEFKFFLDLKFATGSLIGILYLNLILSISESRIIKRIVEIASIIYTAFFVIFMFSSKLQDNVFIITGLYSVIDQPAMICYEIFTIICCWLSFLIFFFSFVKNKIYRVFVVVPLIAFREWIIFIFGKNSDLVYGFQICSVLFSLSLMGLWGLYFYPRRDSLISNVEILDRIDISLIILDAGGRIMFSNNSKVNDSIGVKKLQRAEDLVYNIIGMASEETNSSFFKIILKKDLDTYSEGIITINAYSPNINVSYKTIPIIQNNSYTGKILILRDITLYMDVINKLDIKNKELNEVFIKQKEYSRISSNLALEKERMRILELVNKITDEYINEMKNQILSIELKITSNKDQLKEILEIEIDKLIDEIRICIAKNREIVKSLGE